MSIKFAGDINVKSVVLKSLKTTFALDIINQILAVNIYEDLYSPFITGTISVKESLDLTSALPLIGEEIITLDIETPGLNVGVKGDFYIHKITDKEYVSDRSVVYLIHFISKESIHDLTKKISRNFTGKPSEVASTIYREYLTADKNVFIEPAANTVKYVSNFWSPVENLAFLSRKALTVNGTPSFLTYENNEGFNFRSLDSLYNQKSFATFNYDNSTRLNENNTSSRDINLDYSRITFLSSPIQYDYVNDTTQGVYASKLFSYDILTKQFVSSNYEYTDDYSDRKHMNKFQPRTDANIQKFNSRIDTQALCSEVFTGYGKGTTDYKVQERASILGISRNNTIEIDVPGRFDYTVGKRVTVFVPKMAPIDGFLAKASGKEDYTDKFLSGDYIISAINHKISRSAHSCYMELIKDSSNLDVK